MKQTAVEYLLDNLYLRDTLKWKDIEERAKAMEKEQMIQFADKYADDVMGGCNQRAEEYYNETYERKPNL